MGYLNQRYVKSKFPTLSTSPEEIRVGLTNFYGFRINNQNTSEVFLLLFNNTVDKVTVGTTTPDDFFGVGAKESVWFMLPESLQENYELGLVVAISSQPDGSASPSIPVDVTIYSK